MNENERQRCRTCLSENRDMFSIYDNLKTNYNNIQISQILTLCSSIQISVDDKFPKYICYDCVNLAEQSYNFRLLCEESEEILKNEENKPKLPIEDVLCIIEEENPENKQVLLDEDYGENIEVLEEEYNIEDDKSVLGIEKSVVSDCVSNKKESKEKVIESFDNKCPICSFDFPTQKALTRHIASHKIVPTFYKCHLCPRQFLSTEVLEKHLKLHKNESPVEKLKKFKCLSCFAKFFTLLELSSHVNKVHKISSNSTLESDKIKCYICNETFTDVKLINEHLKTHSNEKKTKSRSKVIYSCSKCDFETPSLNNAKQHLNKTHKLKFNAIFTNLKYKCTECSETFNKIYEIFKHGDVHNQKVHLPKKNFVCEICQKPCKTLSRYRDHKKTHQMKWPRKCSYCNDMIEKRGDYNLHMNEKHENLKEYICNMCGKRFFHQKNLTAHLQIHSGERKFMCDICGWKFQAQNNLVSHLKIHSDEKSYKCPYCSKVFSQSVGLRSHLINHTGERKYECDICNKKFLRIGARNNHRKIHTGQKDYACPLCEKKFTASSTRNKHLLTHTGEKNWVCEYCNKAFSRKSNLSVHRKIHTGETPHVCDICGKGFIQRHVLRSHLMMHRKKGHDKKSKMEKIEEKENEEEVEEIEEQQIMEESEEKYLIPTSTVESFFLEASE